MAPDSSLTAPAQTLDHLVRAQRPGHTLAAEFYLSPDIYRLDIERIFMRTWLYAGHHSQLPSPGTYFLFEVAGESIIIVRDEEQTVHALANVCRHRGSRVCLEQNGEAKTFVCPYHGWAYGLDGRLRSTRYMPPEFDKTANGLKRVHCRVFQGMIFINLADEPADFEPAERALAEHLRAFGIERAKVAHSERYTVDANWKLTIENYVECYHCAPAHQAYARAHSRKAPAERAADLRARMIAQAPAAGLTDVSVDSLGWEAGATVAPYYLDRQPLYDGYVTGSENGEPVAPLLGSIKIYDGGATDFQLDTLNFFLAYSDHVVAYQFIPEDVRESVMEVSWLVREDAEAGKDYDLDRLTWLWRLTTEEDKTIILNNQLGVCSRYYEPQMYSEMEIYAATFVRWYLDQLQS